MQPKIIQTLDGQVIFGQELSMSLDVEWRPTVPQVRDAILEFRITGFNSADLPLLPESKDYASTQAEVQTISAQCRNAVQAGRVIDFGHLPNMVISECARRGGKMWNMGALGFPFSNPWICYHLWDHDIIWRGEGPQPVTLPRVKAVAVYLVNRSSDTTFEVCELQAMKLSGEHLLMIGDRGMFMVPPPGIDHDHISCVAPSILRFTLDEHFRNLQNNGQSPFQAASCNIGDPIICCLMILATRGVERQTIRAPEKLQRARMKSRKPPIPNYDRVATEPYVTAIMARGHRERGEGLGGHHASPQFHIRRGHPREYATGKSIWIRDTLVSATDEQRQSFKANRSHYEMRS
jgi:hypothetical protein